MVSFFLFQLIPFRIVGFSSNLMHTSIWIQSEQYSLVRGLFDSHVLHGANPEPTTAVHRTIIRFHPGYCSAIRTIHLDRVLQLGLFRPILLRPELGEIFVIACLRVELGDPVFDTCEDGRVVPSILDVTPTAIPVSIVFSESGPFPRSMTCSFSLRMS